MPLASGVEEFIERKRTETLEGAPNAPVDAIEAIFRGLVADRELVADNGKPAQELDLDRLWSDAVSYDFWKKRPRIYVPTPLPSDET